MFEKDDYKVIKMVSLNLDLVRVHNENKRFRKYNMKMQLIDY
jgi:hypothetical protein